MGMFKKKVRVSNIYDSAKFFDAEFWIGSGAAYSMIPNEYLVNIGFQPVTTKRITFAGSNQDTRQYGFVSFEMDGFEGKIICPVVDGNDDSIFLFGATALENFSVEIDPVNQVLKPILTIIA